MIFEHSKFQLPQLPHGMILFRQTPLWLRVGVTKCHHAAIPRSLDDIDRQKSLRIISIQKASSWFSEEMRRQETNGLCINNCVSSNFLWHTLWSFLGIRHFPSDVKQMCLLWFRLVLGLQERGYVGDRSFHFGNGSSVIWRTLVFSNLAYKSIDGFSLPKLDPLIPTVLQDDDLVRNPHTSYTKFKRLLKRQWLFWESLRWFLFPWQNWTIWVGILTVSLLMASFASYGNDRFRHGYSTFSQSFWLGCGCVSRLSRGSVFWWDHQGGLTRDSRVRSNEKNLVV